MKSKGMSPWFARALSSAARATSRVRRPRMSIFSRPKSATSPPSHSETRSPSLLIHIGISGRRGSSEMTKPQACLPGFVTTDS